MTSCVQIPVSLLKIPFLVAFCLYFFVIFFEVFVSLTECSQLFSALRDYWFSSCCWSQRFLFAKRGKTKSAVRLRNAFIALFNNRLCCCCRCLLCIFIWLCLSPPNETKRTATTNNKKTEKKQQKRAKEINRAVQC